MTAAICVVVVTLLLGGVLGHLHPPRHRGRGKDLYVNGRRVDLVPLEQFRTHAAPPTPFKLLEPVKPAGLTGHAWKYETALLRRAAREGKLGLPVTKPGGLLAMAAISVAVFAWYVCARITKKAAA